MNLFRKIFNIKKASAAEDIDTQIDFEVKDLKKGYFLDYDLKTWQITDFAVYTWDNGIKDYETTLFDGIEKLYLTYETSNEASSMYWDVKIDMVWKAARQLIRGDKDLSMNTFAYKGQDYHFAGEGSALVRNSKESYGMVNWLFESADTKQLVSINKYDDGFIDAYAGIKLSKHQISNITPGK